MPMTAYSMPSSTIFMSKQPFVTISAPSVYPNGVIYFKNSARSERLAMRFKKYAMAAMPSPSPRPPRRRNAEIPKLLYYIKKGRLRATFCFLRAILLHHSTLLPLAVSLNLAPSISAARLHITMRPRKISKYSYMVQICSSICKLSAMVDFFAFTFNFASVTA